MSARRSTGALATLVLAALVLVVGAARAGRHPVARRAAGSTRSGASTARSTSPRPPAPTSCSSSSSSPARSAVMRDGKTLDRPFLDIHDLVKYGGEQGLLSIAFDPGYAHNRRFYVYYTNQRGNIEVDGFKRKSATRADARSRQKVIVIPHPTFENHNGGQLQFGPDGYLYLGTGDGGSGGDPDGNAQNKSILLGKLLRIDPRKKGGYSVPKSNPFVAPQGQGRDLCDRPAQPVPLLVRLKDEGHLDRRRRPGPVGGDRPRQRPASSRGANFGWDRFEGDHVFEGNGDKPSHYRPPVLRALPRRRLLRDHRRLRRSRQLGAGARRPLRLLRQLQRHTALARPSQPRGQRRHDRARRPGPELVRRRRPGSRLRDVARRARSTASPRTRRVGGRSRAAGSQLSERRGDRHIGGSQRRSVRPNHRASARPPDMTASVTLGSRPVARHPLAASHPTRARQRRARSPRSRVVRSTFRR